MGARSPEIGDGAAAARDAARAILRQSRFHEPPVPRPLAGVLRAVARAFDGLLGGIHIGTASVDVPADVLIAIGVVIVAASAATLASMGVRGQLREVREAARKATATGRSAAQLEAAAAAAERGGDFDRAIRLRFEAGLTALADQGSISRPAVLRAGQLRSRLRSPLFEQLNANFERVAYGGQHASADQAAAARAGWTQLVDDVRE
jgi:hypothetical protein